MALQLLLLLPGKRATMEEMTVAMAMNELRYKHNIATCHGGPVGTV